MQTAEAVRKAAATFEFPGYRAEPQRILVTDGDGFIYSRWVLRVVDNHTGVETFIDPEEWVKKWRWLQGRQQGGLWDQYGVEPGDRDAVSDL